MNRHTYDITKYIQANKANIIAMRDRGFTMSAIGAKYGVSASAICNNLAKWKFYDKPKKSEWLKARQAENTRINDEHIEYIQFERSTEDQRLVSSILCRNVQKTLPKR